MSKTLSAVVVAAGRGLRFQETAKIQQNKVLVSIGGVPLIRKTLDALFVLPIQQLCLVIREDERPFFDAAIREFSQRDRIVYALGGERRQDSVRSGLAALNDSHYVFVHDGARPFLSREFLFHLWDKAQTSAALVPVQPIAETLKEIRSDGSVIRTVDRRAFVRVQTPQFFETEVLREAHSFFGSSRVEFTDDAAMVEARGVMVQTTPGARDNVKVTVAEDLQEALHA